MISLQSCFNLVFQHNLTSKLFQFSIQAGFVLKVVSILYSSILWLGNLTLILDYCSYHFIQPEDTPGCGRCRMVVGFHNYLCNQCLSSLMLWVRSLLSDKVCQWQKWPEWMLQHIYMKNATQLVWVSDYCLMPNQFFFQLYQCENKLYFDVMTISRNGGNMVTVLALSVIDRGFDHHSGQTKNYKIGICCFSLSTQY
jgi:hypothetical protein